MKRFPGARIWWLCGALYALSTCYLLFQGGKTSLMLFVMLNALALYLLLGRWSGIGGVQGVRTLETGGNAGQLTAGMRLSVQLKLQIPGYWPIPYVIVRDKLVRRTGGDSQLYELSVVPDYRRRGAIAYETAPLRRGRYRFQATECSTSDIFGLFEHRGTFVDPAEIQVLPRTIEMREWWLFNRSERGLFQHTHTARWARETTQIDGVREYIHGDRLSRIHWNATAKTGHWKSKEFEREALPRVVFVLDRGAAAYRTADGFELAVSVAASLLELALRKKMPVGFVSAGRHRLLFGAERTIVTREELMQHLIDAEADGAEPLGDALYAAAERFEPGVHFVVVSPLDREDTAPALSSLERKRMKPVLVQIRETPGAKPAPGERRPDWQTVSRMNQWQWMSVGKLEDLPNALEVGAS